MVVDWGAVARAIHVVAVVVWIGGVWLVTTVLLPGMRGKPPEVWWREFDAIEQLFAPQVRVAVVLVLLSGLYMLWDYDMWDRFAHPGEFWWMELMVAVWAVFALALFVIEPLAAWRVRAVRRRAGAGARSIITLPRMLWLHRALLALALAAVFAAVGGAHGLF